MPNRTNIRWKKSCNYLETKTDQPYRGSSQKPTGNEDQVVLWIFVEPCLFHGRTTKHYLGSAILVVLQLSWIPSLCLPLSPSPLSLYLSLSHSLILSLSSGLGVNHLPLLAWIGWMSWIGWSCKISRPCVLLWDLPRQAPSPDGALKLSEQVTSRFIVSVSEGQNCHRSGRKQIVSAFHSPDLSSAWNDQIKMTQTLMGVSCRVPVWEENMCRVAITRFWNKKQRRDTVGATSPQRNKKQCRDTGCHVPPERNKKQCRDTGCHVPPERNKKQCRDTVGATSPREKQEAVLRHCVCHVPLVKVWRTWTPVENGEHDPPPQSLRRMEMLTPHQKPWNIHASLPPMWNHWSATSLRDVAQTWKRQLLQIIEEQNVREEKILVHWGSDKHALHA